MRQMILLCIVFFIISCHGRSVKRQLENFIGTKIIFPENLQGTIRGRDTLLQGGHALMKMVIWYDSIGCSSCQVKQIHEGENVTYANSLKNILDVVFIFSPRIKDINSVYVALHTSDFRFPVYIDYTNSFQEKNPGIPSDERMHTFLVDEKNKVILAGNPVYNEKLWELYKENILSLVN